MTTKPSEGDRRSITLPVRALALTATVAATVLATAAVAAAGYGPTAPPGPPVPGGFSVVIASHTIGPNGGALNATTGLTRLRLRVPAHALAYRVQFTFTRPRLSDLSNATPKGTRLRVGFALLANRTNGTPIRGSFSNRPVSIVVSNPTLTKQARVLAWNQTRHRFVRIAAVARTGQVVITTRHSEEFLVITPT